MPDAKTPPRNRVVALRSVRAGDLVDSPRNWRTHPEKQRAALEAALGEIGIADALLARELPDGRLQLIDGHLRASLDPDLEHPVLVLDVTEDEADKLLLTLDPLAAMATADAEKLDDLMRSVQTGSEALAGMITDLATTHGLAPPDETKKPDVEVAETYSVVVEVENEQQQAALYQQLIDEGYKKIRVLTI